MVIELLFAFIALLSYAFQDVFDKQVLKKLDIFSALILQYFVYLVLTFSLILLSSALLFPSLSVLGLLLLSSIFGAIGIISYFKAVHSAHISLVSSIAASYPFFGIFFAWIFLKEALLLQYLIALPLLLVSVLLLGYKHEERSLDKSVGFALLASFCWGAYSVLAKLISLEINPLNTSFYTEAGVFIGILAYCLYSRRKFVFHPKTKEGKLAIISGFLFVIGTVAFNFSLFQSGVSITTLIVAASPAFTTLLAHFVLKERLSIYQYAGVGLMVLNLLLLSL